MIKRFLRRVTLVATVLVTLIGLTWAAQGVSPASAVGKTELRRALLGTVRILVPIDGEKDTLSSGSGTVLTPDGYILTNFHVVGDKKTGKLNNKLGQAAIGVNPTDLQGLPVWAYLATVVKADAKLDLAVLKVVSTIKGGDLPKALGLVILPIGDSNTVEIGDRVSVIGFPSIGGDSVTYTGGAVSGYLDEDGDGLKEWFKTDAEVNHGNSGGLAINEAGEMIGVPTAGVADTSFSGKISLIRPVNRALPLLKAAMVGGAPVAPSQPSQSATPGTPAAKSPQMSNFIFSDSVDANDRPGTTGFNFPSGTKTLYAFFDYAVFTDGLRLQWYWTVNGEARDVQEQAWPGGAQGTWWVSLGNKNGLADGTYDVNFSFDGVFMGKARATIGSAAPATVKGSISGLTLAEGVSASGPVKPHKATEPFASGINQLYGVFSFKDMEKGTPWSEVWYIDGEEVLRQARDWQFETDGVGYVSVSSKSGLPNGKYKLEIYLGAKLVASAEGAVGEAGSKPVAAGEGVQVIGVIKDKDTDTGIPGAVFVILKDDADPQAFIAKPNEADVLGMGVADSKGMFVLSIALERGKTYSAAVGASGYQPTAGLVKIAPDAESPLPFVIYLQKR